MLDPEINEEVLTHLLAFVDQTTDFFGVSDPWGRILYLNPAAKKRLGVDDARSVTIADLFPPESFGFYYDVVRPELLRTGSWTGEVPVRTLDGAATPMRIATTAKLGPGGETLGGVVHADEVAGAPAAADATELDSTTGLLGSESFADQTRSALAAARRDGQSCALVLVEIDGADRVLNTLDPVAAANVIRSLASRLRRLARTIDVVGRVDDHRLGLLLNGVGTPGEAFRLTQMVRSALIDPPVTTAGAETVPVECRVDISKADDDLFSIIDRIAAKSPVPAPTDHIAQTVTRHQAADESALAFTLDDLHVAMSHHHVIAYARPVVELATGDVVGYEGLARWHHRTLGTLEASAFVDLIADTPLANEVGLYVVRETASVLLLTPGRGSCRLYAPASRRLIADARTEQYLSEIAGAFLLAEHQIHLELPRSLLDDWTPSLQDALDYLKETGVRLVLTEVEDESDADDSGGLGFSELHLSRRLTAAMVTGPGARRVVAAVVRRGHERDLLVAATGVDNRELEEAVVDAGVDLASGDLYGRAEPTDSIDVERRQ